VAGRLVPGLDQRPWPGQHVLVDLGGHLDALEAVAGSALAVDLVVVGENRESCIDLPNPLVDRAKEGKTPVEARGAERIVGRLHAQDFRRAVLLICSFLITMPDLSSFLMKYRAYDEVSDEVMTDYMEEIFLDFEVLRR
jgi:hypothetical protein